METATLIIGIITLVSTTISPLVLAGAYFIKNIQKSSCLGGSVEMKSVKELQNELHETKSTHKIEIDKQNENINKIMEMLNNNNPS